MAGEKIKRTDIATVLKEEFNSRGESGSTN